MRSLSARVKRVEAFPLLFADTEYLEEAIPSWKQQFLRTKSNCPHLRLKWQRTRTLCG
jgi:hypothetical protein